MIKKNSTRWRRLMKSRKHEAQKKEMREKQFPKDLEAAYQMGARLNRDEA